MYNFVSNSERETIEIAKSFAKELNPNDIIILDGELGARKNQIY